MDTEIENCNNQIRLLASQNKRITIETAKIFTILRDKLLGYDKSWNN
jgi:hypothetical protein